MKTQDNRYDSEDTKELLNPTFTEASSRANIASGESHKTIFGKIKKFFSDLKTVAFTGAYSDLSGTPNLATVATSGKYSDLSGTPNLATVATSGKYSDLSGKPSLATVATSGSYNDLSGKPTIPTVNNGTLTIQKNGSNVATFTANQSGNATANISVPTDNSQIGNGAGYITSAGTAAAINNGHWYTAVDGVHKAGIDGSSNWGVINAAGNLYAFYTHYESGDTTIRGKLDVNGDITTGGTLSIVGTAIKIYGCEFNVTPKTGYPYFRNPDGVNFCIVLGDNDHKYKLSWTGTELVAYVDNTYVGAFTMH